MCPSPVGATRWKLASLEAGGVPLSTLDAGKRDRERDAQKPLFSKRFSYMSLLSLLSP
jgi:hypothetical protein